MESHYPLFPSNDGDGQMQVEPSAKTRTSTRLSIRLAGSEADVVNAQRLRWQVFANEQGARLDSPTPGLDIDPFDDVCDHLIVTDVEQGDVIGTYRLLTADAARRCGGYYSESEFDLTRLLSSKKNFLEIGRSCIHPDHRTGAAIALLWSGLASYLVRSRHDALIGCASIPLRGQEASAALLAHTLAGLHGATEALRVTPRRALPSFAVSPVVPVATPPLLKGYLRSGAVVCGDPYWDPDFQSADLFLHLAVENIEARYARHFLSSAA